jgi:hypothetical protein
MIIESCGIQNAGYKYNLHSKIYDTVIPLTLALSSTSRRPQGERGNIISPPGGYCIPSLDGIFSLDSPPLPAPLRGARPGMGGVGEGDTYEFNLV